LKFSREKSSYNSANDLVLHHVQDNLVSVNSCRIFKAAQHHTISDMIIEKIRAGQTDEFLGHNMLTKEFCKIPNVVISFLNAQKILPKGILGSCYQ